jgi:hypothetical protein
MQTNPATRGRLLPAGRGEGWSPSDMGDTSSGPPRGASTRRGLVDVPFLAVPDGRAVHTGLLGRAPRQSKE